MGLILPQKVEVRWMSTTKEHFLSIKNEKGEQKYKYTKYKDIFLVDVLDLQPKTKKEVKIICDYCGKKSTIPFISYKTHVEGVVSKVPCRKCYKKKKEEANMVKFGGKSPFNSEAVRNKAHETMVERYGAKTTLESSVLKERVEQTNLKKYGVKNVLNLKETREKMKQTNLEKYGKEYYTETEEMKEKSKQTCLEKYGTENPRHSEEISDKAKKTMNERYGKDYYTQTEEMKEKSKQTNLERYGVEHAPAAPEVVLKIKQTNLKNLGVTNPLSSKEVQAKIKQTNLEKYGVENPLNVPEIREKISKTIEEKHGVPWYTLSPDMPEKTMKTMYANGTQACSKQQKYLYDLFGGELNYPVGPSSLDIAFLDEKIYLEYDGSGHDLTAKLSGDEEAFKKKEERRYYALRDAGWRGIRIISKRDKLPSDQKLIELVNDAKEYLKTGHRWYEIDIDESMVRCSQFEKKIDLGELRTLKRENKKVTQ